MKKYITLLLIGIGIISTGVFIGVAMWIARKNQLLLLLSEELMAQPAFFSQGK